MSDVLCDCGLVHASGEELRTRTISKGLLDELLKGCERSEDRLGDAELTAYLGYEDGKDAPADQANRRNGSSSKVLKGQDGALPMSVPRDRNGSVEPDLIKKGQIRIDGIDDKIVGLYAAGLTVWNVGCAAKALLSRHVRVAKAIDYLLSPDHWPGFTRFLEDSRICLTNNAAERSLRGVALGGKSWLFAGFERGGQRAAFMSTLIGTAKLNGINPQAWPADVTAHISDRPVSRLPWAWNAAEHQVKAA